MLMHVIGLISVVLLFEWVRLKDEYTSHPNPKVLTCQTQSCRQRVWSVERKLIYI